MQPNVCYVLLYGIEKSRCGCAHTCNLQGGTMSNQEPCRPVLRVLWEPSSTQTKPTISKNLSAICNQEFAALFCGLVSQVQGSGFVGTVILRKWKLPVFDLFGHLIEHLGASCQLKTCQDTFCTRMYHITCTWSGEHCGGVKKKNLIAEAKN